MLFFQLIRLVHIMKPYQNNQCHKRVNILAVPPLLSAECKLPLLRLTFLENLETDSGSSGMIARDLWRMMEVDLVVSL